MTIHHWWWKIKLFDLLICVFVFVSLCLEWPPTPLLPDIYIFTYLLCVFFYFVCLLPYYIMKSLLRWDVYVFSYVFALPQPYELCSLLGHNIVCVFLSWIENKVEKKSWSRISASEKRLSIVVMCNLFFELIIYSIDWLIDSSSPSDLAWVEIGY